jgi:hypothetical protein
MEIMLLAFDVMGTKVGTGKETEIETETEIEGSPMAFVFTIAAIFRDDRNAGARVQICVILLQQATGVIESRRFA